MRKVINGRTYNTETSKHIGGNLRKNTKGAYFLADDKQIIPLSDEEAAAWARKHLNIDLTEPAGESVSDLVSRERVNLTIDTVVITNMRKYSEQTGIPMGRMVDKAIMAMYGEQFKELNKE